MQAGARGSAGGIVGTGSGTAREAVQSAGDVVYAGAGGELFCVDGTTGSIRWRNKLKGLGSGLVSFAGASAVEAAAAMAAAQEAAAAAAIVAVS